MKIRENDDLHARAAARQSGMRGRVGGVCTHEEDGGEEEDRRHDDGEEEDPCFSTL